MVGIAPFLFKVVQCDTFVLLQYIIFMNRLMLAETTLF